MENFWYLFAAYMVILMSIFAYIIKISRGQKKIQKELDFIRMKGVDNVERFMELNYKLLGGRE